MKALTQHLSPEPSEIYETFRFQSLKQNEGKASRTTWPNYGESQTTAVLGTL